MTSRYREKRNRIQSIPPLQAGQQRMSGQARAVTQPTRHRPAECDGGKALANMPERGIFRLGEPVLIRPVTSDARQRCITPCQVLELKNKLGLLGPVTVDIDSLILAEFAAASLLICAGSVLGRLKMVQHVYLGLLFVPCYAVDEWILASGGLGLIPAGRFVDTGGSILIHAFGAFFGLAAILRLTTRAEFETRIEADSTSDRFSMVGSMVLADGDNETVARARNGQPNGHTGIREAGWHCQAGRGDEAAPAHQPARTDRCP